MFICREHATAMQNVDVHLLKQHGIKGRARKELVQYCSRFCLAAPRHVRLPLPLRPPIEELGEPLDGFQCTCSGSSCSFLTISLVKLQIHCKKEHRRSWIGNTAALYQKAKVQTFFRAGGLQRYFVVDAGADVTDGGNCQSAASRTVADVVNVRLVEWKRTKDAHEEEAQVMDAQVAKTDKTGWFKRTG